MIAYKQRVMDMDKLTMAHEYFRDTMSFIRQNNINHEFDEIIKESWEYADAMQDEADKRNQDSRSLTKDENGNCLHFHHEFGHKKCMDCGASLDDWQPDWSQAPVGFNSFVVGSDGGSGFFTNIEPKLMGDFYFIGPKGMIFDDHGYKGDWKDSLRKRPQGI